MLTLSNGRLLAICVVSALFMTGCATEVRPTIARIDNAQFQAAQNIEAMNANRTTGAVVRHATARLMGEAIEIREAENLPALFSKQFNYLTVPRTLQEILTEIGRRTALPIDLQNGVLVTQSSNGMPPGGVGQNQAGGMLALDWRGTLAGLLDHLAAQTGIFWEYQEGRLVFFKTKTKTFHIHLPSGKRVVDASIALAGVSGGTGSSGSAGGASTGGSSSSSGQVSVTSKTEIDAYQAISEAVQNIIRNNDTTGSNAGNLQVGMPGGGAAAGAGMPGGTNSASYNSDTVALNPSLGLLTVTTNPILMERVERFIKNVNERFARNVMIGIKVFNVKRERRGNAGASLSLAYENLSKNFKLDMKGTPNMSPSNGTAGQLVISPLPGASFTGTGLILQALETIGDVSLRTSGQVIAANGQPTPLQVARDVTYIASQATTITPDAGSTTTITPATRTVGFTANFLPTILGDNRILLQYQINLSEISFKQFDSNDTAIQTPDVATQSFQQQAYVRDGETIVLFGYEQERANYSKSSGLTGVSNNADDARDMIVIVMEVFNGK